MRPLYIFSLFFLLIFQSSFSAVYPYWPGTRSGSAIAGTEISIVKEKVNVTIKNDGQNADITVEYLLKNENPGNQIPMLFYAEDYTGGFLVWLNDQSVQLEQTGNNFDYTQFRMPEGTDNEQLNLFYGDFGKKDGEVSLPLNKLKYFKADLNKGIHKVVVKYTAGIWSDQSGKRLKNMKEYSYRYALGPAKQWGTSAGLDLTVKRMNSDRNFTINLEDPTETPSDSEVIWKMETLPSDDFIEIKLVPKVSSLHQKLLGLFPISVWSFGALLLLPLVWWAAARRIKRNPDKNTIKGLLVWALLYPLLVFGWMLLTSFLIDKSNNPEIYIPGGVAFQFILYLIAVIVFSFAVLLPVLRLSFKNSKQNL